MKGSVPTDLVSVHKQIVIRSKKKCHSFNYSGYPYAQKLLSVRKARAISVRRKLSSVRTARAISVRKKLSSVRKAWVIRSKKIVICWNGWSYAFKTIGSRATVPVTVHLLINSPLRFHNIRFISLQVYPRLRCIQQIPRTSYYVLNFQSNAFGSRPWEYAQ